MVGPTHTVRWSTVQPWRGLFAFAVTFFLALVITVSCSIDNYLGMTAIWIICMVPIQLIVDIGWGCQYPPTGFLPQPWRGMALTAFVGLVGTVVAFAIVHLAGTHVAHPYLSVFVIFVVVTTIIVTTNFSLWPFDTCTVPVRGMIWAVLAPVIVFFIIKLLNFSYLSFVPGAPGPVPFYKGGIPLPAPTTGPIPWECDFAWFMWLAFLSFTWVMLDFWPFNRVPGLMKQPVLGFTVLSTNCVLSLVIYQVGTRGLGLEPLDLLYCGISYAFGLLTVLVVFQKWPGRLIGGLGGNLLDLLLAIMVAVVAYHATNVVCAWHFGRLPYPQKIFTSATFMLGLNFPLWVAYCDFWQMWPLPSGEAATTE